MSGFQDDPWGWIGVVGRVDRSRPAKVLQDKLAKQLREAEALTAGVLLSAAFVAPRSPDIAKELLAYHERFLAEVRFSVILECVMLIGPAVKNKRPAHRPVGSRSNEDGDFAAAIVARMVLLGRRSPGASEAIRRGIKVAEEAGVTVYCYSATSRERRIREYLRTNSAHLDEVLRLADFPGL